MGHRMRATFVSAVLLAATLAQGSADMAGKGSSSSADRCVLPNVPRVGFYEGRGAPEDDLLPSCVKAFLQMRGEDLGFLSRPNARDPWHDLRCYILGMSGCAFRMMCDRKEWTMADGSPWAFAADPIEPARRALAAAGYGMECSLRKPFTDAQGGTPDPSATEARWRKRIVESIRDRGKPVIAIGVIGPPEPCLITGYDEGGAVLIGWSAFQGMPEFDKGVEIEPSGYFRKRRWFAGTQGLIFIGEKLPVPAGSAAGPGWNAVRLNRPRATFRDALAFGLQALRTPHVRGRLGGQAAFSLWADQLLDDSLFTAKNKKALGNRFFVHHERGGALAEARAYGASFLRFAAEAHPEARNELIAAAKCFHDEHDLVWAIWEFTGGMVTSDEGARKFASPSTRRRIVPLIRLLRRRDADAAAHIQKAIEQIDHARHQAAAGNLATNPKAVVKREVGKVWIEGVPALAWGAGRDCTFLGSLEAATAVTGRPLRYADMMGATGIAFRLRWSNPDTKGGWDRGCACGEYMEEWDDVQRGTGWELHAEFPGVTQDPPTDPQVQRVKRHIDAGWPVMASVDGPDIGVIVGYADEGRTMLACKYGSADTVACDAREACGGFQLHLGGIVTAPEPRRVLAAALRTAVRNWRRDKTSAGYAKYGHEWLYGEQAMKAWADDLVKRDPTSANAKDAQPFYEANHFVYLSLLDARKAAVAYLRSNAPIVEGEARDAVCRAAEAYEREVALLAGPVEHHAPWLAVDKQPAAQWSADQRKAQSELLQAALKIEAEAIRDIATAAHALELVPPASAPHDPDQWAVLPGVPKVGYGVHLCPFPGSLFAALQYVGDPAEYDFLMGATGACFRRFWEKDDGGNVDLMYMGEEPIKRAALALNRELTVVGRKDRGAMIAALKESIGAGRPVIGFGIIGPPEAGLVTGYDRGCDVLTGWSYFQDGALPGYYQQSDWYDRASWPGDLGLVVIGDKECGSGLSRRDLLRSTLVWALDLSRTAKRPERPGHVAGLAAYQAWAAALEIDADYPRDNVAVMSTRVMVHGDQCCMLEERRNAAGFLRAMAKDVPELRDDLLAAASLYDEAANAKAWPWGHDMGEAARNGLADPAARRQIAAEIRRAAAAETKAVRLLEKACAALSGPKK